MLHPICETCGTQFAAPREHCPVCTDERQYVGWLGQRWTTHAALAERHRLRLEDEAGLLAIGLAPAFAIDQRALVLPTAGGNLLWECLSLVTAEAVEALRARGGIAAIVISHPHFYGAMVEWSDALGGVPVWLHEADAGWVARPSPRIRFWHGERHALADGVTLLRLGGHFPGSTGLHWRGALHGRGMLFAGDAMQVCADRRHVSFMLSYPNYLPLAPREVRRMRALLDGLCFDDVFGYTWGRNILGGARAAVDRSFDRYLAAIEDRTPHPEEDRR